MRGNLYTVRKAINSVTNGISKERYVLYMTDVYDSVYIISLTPHRDLYKFYSIYYRHRVDYIYIYTYKYVVYMLHTRTLGIATLNDPPPSPPYVFYTRTNDNTRVYLFPKGLVYSGVEFVARD